MKNLKFFGQYLTQAWYANAPWLHYLKPMAKLFQTASVFRRHYYQNNAKKITKFPVPIIVVGNITVGGTGKTPLVIWLANFLTAHGYHPGIVSRGYGGNKQHAPQAITLASDPQQVGDEALLLKQHTQCPVIVAALRVKAVEFLLAHHPNCNVVITDDGLQHYALGRDIEIAVIDGERRLGNGLCLPAGPLREPMQRLAEVDFIVSNGMAQPGEYAMQFTYTELKNVANPELTAPFAQFNSGTIHAIAGIGNPNRFFTLLQKQGMAFQAHVFPDHYLYSAKDIDFGKDAIVLMTEKDAVKCRRFADHRYWYLPVQAELPTAFAEAILNKLAEMK